MSCSALTRIPTDISTAHLSPHWGGRDATAEINLIVLLDRLSTLLYAVRSLPRVGVGTDGEHLTGDTDNGA